MNENPDGSKNTKWLSLGETAELLGVHPSTVRSWADQGQLPVVRTQGGHRRFHLEDVERRMNAQIENPGPEADSVVQNILRTTRLQIGEGRIEGEAWYRKLDEEARHQYRLSGRSLVQGLIGHLNSNGEGMEAEARSLGYEYASRGRRCGLSSVEAAHAYLFFRTLVQDSVLSAYESANVRSPHIWTDMYRKMNTFADLILITLLETYEAFQRGPR